MMHANYERDRRERLAAYGTTVTRVDAYRDDEYSKPYRWRVTYLDGESRDFWRMCDRLPDHVLQAMDEAQKHTEHTTERDADGDEVECWIDHYTL